MLEISKPMLNFLCFWLPSLACLWGLLMGYVIFGARRGKTEREPDNPLPKCPKCSATGLTAKRVHFPETEAEVLALENDFILRQCTSSHYQLTTVSPPKWIYNLYPSTSKIHIDPHYRGPRLKVKGRWTVLDAVKAAIEAKKGSHGPKS